MVKWWAKPWISRISKDNFLSSFIGRYMWSWYNFRNEFKRGSRVTFLEDKRRIFEIKNRRFFSSTIVHRKRYYKHLPNQLSIVSTICFFEYVHWNIVYSTAHFGIFFQVYFDLNLISLLMAAGSSNKSPKVLFKVTVFLLLESLASPLDTFFTFPGKL